LDQLLAALRSPAEVLGPFRAAYSAAAVHYAGEDEFFRGLLPELHGPAAKMLAQHAEALEIAAQVENSLATGQTSDAVSLMRRFHAVAQHNIIEEERDVFPLCGSRSGKPPDRDTIATESTPEGYD
jgi:hypothetical protein